MSHNNDIHNAFIFSVKKINYVNFFLFYNIQVSSMYLLLVCTIYKCMVTLVYQYDQWLSFFLGFTNKPATNQAHMFPCHDNTKKMSFFVDEQLLLLRSRSCTTRFGNERTLKGIQYSFIEHVVSIMPYLQPYYVQTIDIRYFAQPLNISYLLTICTSTYLVLKCTLGVKVQVHAMSVQSSHNHHFNTYCCC